MARVGGAGLAPPPNAQDRQGRGTAVRPRNPRGESPLRIPRARRPQAAQAGSCRIPPEQSPQKFRERGARRLPNGQPPGGRSPCAPCCTLVRVAIIDSLIGCADFMNS